MELVKEFCGAAGAGDLEKVREILSHNHSLLDQRDAFGPALHWAVLRGSREVVQYLLEWGADPNLRSEDGTTALDIAYREAQEDLQEILRSYGAVRSKAKGAR